MLSPWASSGASGEAMRRRNPPLVALRSRSSPTDSTSPVNIPFDQDIGPERLDHAIVERGRAKRSSQQQLDTVFAEHVRRDVEADDVDELLVPGRAVQRGAALDHQ